MVMLNYRIIFGMAIGFAFLAMAVKFVMWQSSLKRRWIQTGSHRAARKVSLAEVDQLEISIGGKLHKTLKEAYLDGTISSMPVPAKFYINKFEYVITHFIQLDAEANGRLLTSIHVPTNAFVFAADDFGNFYFVLADRDSMHFWDHEFGETHAVLESLAELWSLMIPQ
jgi:hypothetical protein